MNNLKVKQINSIFKGRKQRVDYLCPTSTFFVIDLLTIILIFVFSAVVILSYSKVYASEKQQGLVKRITASEAAGRTNKKLVTINLSPGYGINLSFPGEKIYKIWFDNPGIASLDSNGCLSGLGRVCPEGEKPADILHLRSIKPIDIPGLIKTNSSLLTVISENPNKGHNIYLFQIVAQSKSGNNNISTIEIVPDTETTPTKMRSLIASQKDFNTIHKGLIKAFNQNLIKKDSPLWQRIINFSTQVRQGKDIKQAAQNAGISMQLVNKLEELGNIHK